MTEKSAVGQKNVVFWISLFYAGAILSQLDWHFCIRFSRVSWCPDTYNVYITVEKILLE